MLSFLKSIFGTKNDRELRGVAPILTKINLLEAVVAKLSNEELRAKTDEFKNRHKAGETLQQLLLLTRSLLLLHHQACYLLHLLNAQFSLSLIVVSQPICL